MKKIILFLIILLTQTTNIHAENEIKKITVGNNDAKITIIAYESLTCSHCADFHINVYPELKREYIDTGIAKIEFRHFPLDVAAFNASKISLCKNDGSAEILNTLFLNQQKWVKGKSIEEINKNLKDFLIFKDFKIDFNQCTTDKMIEDFILNDRIEGTKKFNVNATPTIIINDEKFEKSLNYKNLKKTLEKLI
jgi:protein-disulfide isomerase